MNATVSKTVQGGKSSSIRSNSIGNLLNFDTP